MHDNYTERKLFFELRIDLLLLENNEVGFPTLASVFKLFLTISTNFTFCERSFSC